MAADDSWGKLRSSLREFPLRSIRRVLRGFRLSAHGSATQMEAQCTRRVTLLQVSVVRSRLDLMGATPTPYLKCWGTWLPDQPPQVGNQLLLAITKEVQPLMIFDPFRYAHGAEENDSTEMMVVMRDLRACVTAGATVIIFHHPAKVEGSTGRGSTAIRGAVDLAYMQELSDETGLITLRCVKNRFGERPSLTIKPNF